MQYRNSAKISLFPESSKLSDAILFAGRTCRPVVPDLRQRKGDEAVARLRALLAASAGGDANILLPIHRIRTRRGIAACRKLVFPQQLPVALIKGVELLVLAPADKNQSPGRDNGAAKILRAGGGDALGGQFRKLTEWNLPRKIAAVKIDGGQQTPRRFDGRIILLVSEIPVAGQVISLPRFLQRCDIRRFIRIHVQ